MAHPFVSTGGGVNAARSAAALPFVSTGGGVNTARSAAAQPFVSTGGGVNAVAFALPNGQSKILRGSMLLLWNTKGRKLPRCTCMHAAVDPADYAT